MPGRKQKIGARYLALTILSLYALCPLRSSPPAPADKEGLACPGLLQTRISNVELRVAEPVAAGVFRTPDGKTYQVPAFCRVSGVARPTARSEINFEVWLPGPSQWNGRFYQHGQGDSGGSINYEAMAFYVGRGDAVAATDDGVRRSSAGLANLEALYRVWAQERDNPQQVIDNSYRAMTETTRSAKTLVRAYYQTRRFRSYFAGCSGGGNYALKAIQRMPDEWDGALVGAPSNNTTRYFVANIWNSRRWLDPEARLRPEHLPLIQKAALASCGRRAQVIDGIATDPRFCRFDPGVLLCRPGKSKDCLTPKQIGTLRLLYSGPVNPRTGKQIYPGLPPTSETSWTFLVDQPAGGVPFNLYSANVFLQYVYGPQERDKRLVTFDFDKDLRFAERLPIAGLPLREVYNATATDLTAFRDQGSKVIMYFGWADSALTPLEGVRYYENVARASGGMARTRDFFRLFMVPGMGHCGGGSGANAFGQYLGYALHDDPSHNIRRALEAWVEQGRVPDKVVAAKYVDIFKPDKGVSFTRPLCPHPETAVYNGVGDRNSAASFTCKAPKREGGLL